MPTPHEVLDVPPDADEGTVEAAYRRQVKAAHPDQGGSARDLRRVLDAYETLANGEVDPFDVDDVADVDSAPDEPVDPQVTYLDYDVVADAGWDLTDDDLLEKAAAVDLDDADLGEFTVGPDETLLEAAERCGYTWPYSCRGGACANCAVCVLEGDLSMPASHVLPEDLMERGIRLSCVGRPTTPETTVVYNVKHLPKLEDLRLPPGPFEWANASD